MRRPGRLSTPVSVFVAVVLASPGFLGPRSAGSASAAVPIETARATVARVLGGETRRDALERRIAVVDAMEPQFNAFISLDLEGAISRRVALPE